MKDRSIDEMIANAMAEPSLATITPHTDVSREEKDATMAIPQNLKERAASLRAPLIIPSICQLSVCVSTDFSIALQ